MAEYPPIFRFRDSTGHMREATDGPVPHPRMINDYIVDPNKWTRLPEAERNAHSILSKGTADRNCIMCGAAVPDCPGQPCVDAFHVAMSDYGQIMTEVRSAGALSKGVFATEDIDEATWLGEYLGEIVPPWPRYRLTNEESYYTFDIDGRYSVNARQVRNWTAYMNHHCNENVEPVTFIYAGRYVMAFRTKRRIKKDEQLFTWYGSEYFEDGGILCLFDNEEGAHLPPAGPFPVTSVPDPSKPTTPAPAPQGPSLESASEGGRLGFSTSWNNDTISIRLRIALA